MTLTEKQRRTLTLMRKSVPWIFLAIYGWCWSVLLRLTADVINGAYVLPDDQIFSNAVLTCYTVDAYMLGIILLAFVLVRKCFAPDTFQSYKIRELQKEVKELHERISGLEDRLGEDRLGDQGTGTETETLVHVCEDSEDRTERDMDSGVSVPAVHSGPVCDGKGDI